MKRIVCILMVLLLSFSVVSCTEDPPAGTEKENYYAVLYNSEHLTEKDAAALSQLLALYPSYEILPINVKACEDATEVYSLLCEACTAQEGTLAGVQIVGTVSAVPAFHIDYKVTLPSGYTAGEAFFSDYFYQNLTSSPDALADFTVADHFEGNASLSLTPMHPVIRLPLGSGELSSYLTSYRDYIERLNGATPAPVSFSSSIFRYDNSRPDGASADDMAVFLSRAEKEWGILEETHAYTNQEGLYLSPAPSLGDITKENLQNELREGVKEIFFSGHGSRDALVRTVFKEDGTQVQSVFLSSADLATLSGENPYFLNLHACDTARGGIGESFVRTALQNGCLGAFSATALISNNGIDCRAEHADMTSTPNFFGFHYAYLAAKNTGSRRSDAFFAAQKAFAATLAECAKRELDYAASYEFGYHNLLTYANFGIFEPDVTSFPTVENTVAGSQNPLPEEIFIHLTKGEAADDEYALPCREMVNHGVRATVSKVIALPLDNDRIRFFIEVEAKGTFARLMSNTGIYCSAPVSLAKCVLVADVSANTLRQDGLLGIEFSNGTQNAVFCVDVTPLF